jgi:hypothetical protein
MSLDDKLREIAAKLYNHDFFVMDKTPDSPIYGHGDESVVAAIKELKQAILDLIDTLEEKDEGEPGSFNVGYNWALDDVKKLLKGKE